MPDSNRDKHLNIGVFTDSYRPYTSGVVRSIDLFAKELRNMGHKVYIFAPKYPDCEPEEFVFRFRAVPAPTLHEFSLALPISISLRQTVKRLGINIIHAQSPFMMGRLGASVAKRHGLPLVFTYHTLYDKYVHYFPFLQGLSQKLVLSYVKDFCSRCNLVIAPTAPVADMVRQQGAGVPVVSIPTGIDLDDFNSLDRTWLKKRFGLPANAKCLLFVGRLGKEKNIEFLLECFARLRKRNQTTPLKLVLVGGGSAEEALAICSRKLNLGDDVIFTGTLPKEEVVQCYAGADIMVFASVTETQGLVLAEAKASGLPIVAVEAPGIREMVTSGEDGYFTRLSLEEFTERVEQLLHNEALRVSMGMRAKQAVKAYSSRSTAGRLCQEYLRLAAVKPNEPVEQVV